MGRSSGNINYRAKYSRDEIVGLFDQIAPFWKQSAKEVQDLDAGKLYDTLFKIVDEWRALEDYTHLDRELQALLAMVSATKWFTTEQVHDIDWWLHEVADCGEPEDWMVHFPEDQLRKVVLSKLKAKEIREVTIDKVGKAITVEYRGGDHGSGPHDGIIHMSDHELWCSNHAEPEQYMSYLGELPSDCKELGKCLASPNWDIITGEHQAGDFEEDWMVHFKESDLKKVVISKLAAKEVSRVTINKVGKEISIEYKGGDFGSGYHDGAVHLSDHELWMVDHTTPGQYLSYLGDLPADAKQLGKCLTSSKWEEKYDDFHK